MNSSPGDAAPDIVRDFIRDVVRDDLCFCCGADHDRGLQLTFTYDGEGTAETTLRIPVWFAGWKRMTHGGLLSMLLDECMAHACISVLGHAITAELTVRYHAPVETGREVMVRGTIKTVRSKIVETTGTIVDAEGKSIASGTARFLIVKTAEDPP